MTVDRCRVITYSFQLVKLLLGKQTPESRARLGALTESYLHRNTDESVLVSLVINGPHSSERTKLLTEARAAEPEAPEATSASLIC